MSNLAPKTSLRERVSAAILDAAATALASREQASMGDVAEAAGVARATLYRYYPTRDALLEALTQFALEDTGERLDAAGLDRVSVGEGFTRCVRALVAVGDHFIVLARERTGPARPEFDRRVAGPLRKLIERGQEDGEIREDVNASWLLESLIALVVTVLPSAPSLGPEDTVDAIASLFLDGARGPRSSAGT